MRGLYSALALCTLIFDVTAAVKHPRLREVTHRSQEKVNKAVHEATHERLIPRYANSSTNDTSRFLSNTTASQSHPLNTTHHTHSSQSAEYKITSLPDVNFDIGEMYSGLIPIDEKNASRALFFMFNPTIGNPVDEITIWLNGGPGCSSLEGFFQENGKFLWQPGTFAPAQNP